MTLYGARLSNAPIDGHGPRARAIENLAAPAILPLVND